MQKHFQKENSMLDPNGLESIAGQASSPLVKNAKKSPLDFLLGLARERIKTLLDLWRKPAVGILASAMIVGQMGLLAAMVKFMYRVEPAVTVVTPAKGEKGQANVMVLSVIFVDKATALEMRQAIDSVEGYVVGGPGALGVWEVAVPKSKIVEATRRLESNKLIESVANQ
jgi:hypothetical protein